MVTSNKCRYVFTYTFEIILMRFINYFNLFKFLKYKGTKFCSFVKIFLSENLLSYPKSILVFLKCVLFYYSTPLQLFIIKTPYKKESGMKYFKD